MAVSNGMIAYGGTDRKIHLGSLQGEEVKEGAVFEDSRGEVISLAFSPDGTKLAGGDVSVLSFWTSLNVY